MMTKMIQNLWKLKLMKEFMQEKVILEEKKEEEDIYLKQEKIKIIFGLVIGKMMKEENLVNYIMIKGN